MENKASLYDEMQKAYEMKNETISRLSSANERLEQENSRLLRNLGSAINMIRAKQNEGHD